MKLVTSIAAGATALALAGGLWATQASAGPTTPAPGPTSSAERTRGAGVAVFYGALTEVQRQCLADAGLQRPEGGLTEDQVSQLRQQVQAALASCGITVPDRVTARPRLGFRWAALTTEQQQCLAEQRLTRPVGRLTDEQRATVRQSMLDAAKSCGVG